MASDADDDVVRGFTLPLHYDRNHFLRIGAAKSRMFIRNYPRCCTGLSPDFLYNRASSSAITLLGHHWLQSMAAETAILPPRPLFPRSFALLLLLYLMFMVREMRE